MTQVIKKSIKKISYLFYHTNNAYWFRKDLRVQIESFPRNENVSIHFDNLDETIQYIKNCGYYYPMEIKTGLTEGHLYTKIKYRGAIVGYNKTGFSKVYIEDFKGEYQFPQNVAYTYDIFIDPEYRNQDFGTLLLCEVCNYLKERKFKSIWAHIPPWNIASIAMHQKLGFQRKKMIAYYWIAGISWTSTNPIKLIQYVENSCKK